MLFLQGTISQKSQIKKKWLQTSKERFYLTELLPNMDKFFLSFLAQVLKLKETKLAVGQLQSLSKNSALFKKRIYLVDWFAGIRLNKSYYKTVTDVNLH